MEKRVFVYGTLMSGFANYKKYLVNNVTNIIPAYTEGQLYHLKKYNCPALIHGKDRVYGEVITYNDDEIESLTKIIDEFEKYFANNDKVAYVRQKIKVTIKGTNKNEEIDAYIFVDNDRLKEDEVIYVESGDWKTIGNAIGV